MMMDKSCNSSGDSASVNNRDNHHLRQLNKLSHKISKPTTTSSSSSSISAAVNQETDHQFPHPPPQQQINHGNLHQHQPPVYNINKNDFRDVVQKLTGSPAHERISSPPQQPVHHPKAQQSSRLHRIRPPPLAHVINRPPPSLNNAALVPPPSWSGGFVAPRHTAPLSPLPPLPPVHAAAESPVSSYMRYLQNSMFAMESNRREFSPLAPLVSPRWYQQQQENAPPPVNSGRPPPGTVSQAPPQSLGCLSSPKSPYGLLSPSLLLSPTSAPLVSPRWYQQQQENAPPPVNSGRPPPGTVSQAPPQSLGCLSSPKSPYGLLSPSLLLSPTSGQLGFPASPTTVPLPSPK
ncbi:hypothetical protein DY000_02064227 [Brassica cretica]|uniref:VQ domain-containing protein n=1 Tax=Brassica cretica TaxID=69181 RepID=A0ABQ7ARI8_BRACR|nr:hypothetical protein DY000_02064227 [Brassica cretica]